MAAKGAGRVVTSAIRPEVTLKAAVTLDGRIATRTGDSRWITGEAARTEAHRMRARCDAVMVGVGTVRADDPELTVRMVRGKQPLRVVLDSHLRMSPKSRLASAGTLVFHSAAASDRRRKRLARSGVELTTARARRGGGLSLTDVLKQLAGRGIRTLLVEGGGQLHGALLDGKLVDRVAVFMAPRIVGDDRAVAMAAGRGVARIADATALENLKFKRLGDDMLIVGDVRGTP